MASAADLNPNEVKEITDRLWDDVSVVDEYLREHQSDLDEEHKEIFYYAPMPLMLEA